MEYHLENCRMQLNDAVGVNCENGGNTENQSAGALNMGEVVDNYCHDYSCQLLDNLC